MARIKQKQSFEKKFFFYLNNVQRENISQQEKWWLEFVNTYIVNYSHLTGGIPEIRIFFLQHLTYPLPIPDINKLQLLNSPQLNLHSHVGLGPELNRA